jgi:hypothetical protein
MTYNEGRTETRAERRPWVGCVLLAAAVIAILSCTWLLMAWR